MGLNLGMSNITFFLLKSIFGMNVKTQTNPSHQREARMVVTMSSNSH